MQIFAALYRWHYQGFLGEGFRQSEEALDVLYTMYDKIALEDRILKDFCKTL